MPLLLVLQHGIILAVVYVVIMARRGVTWALLGFRPPPPSGLRAAAGLAMLALPAVWAVNFLSARLAGFPAHHPQMEMLAPTQAGWPAMAATTLVVAVVVPAVEETAFRGLLYGWLRSRLGIAGAGAISALAFAVLHGMPVFMPALFLLGLVLAWLYERYRSLWVPVAFHGVFNAAMLALLYAGAAAG